MPPHNNRCFFNFFRSWPAILLIFVGLVHFELAAQEPDNYSVRTVVLDAGHGGKDSGALGKNSKEKDVTLPLALKVGALIAQEFPEIRVAYTRQTDTFIGLRDRSEFANNQHADLFISIHCNSFKKNTVHGVETYVMGLRRSKTNLDIALRENAVITYEDDYQTKYEGYDPNSEESFIIFSMIQNLYLDQSLAFADLVQSQLLRDTPFDDRGVKQDIFWVLVGTTMPSILVEVGFISNQNDEEYITSDDGQNTIAKSIFEAFKAYKLDVDRKNKITLNNQPPPGNETKDISEDASQIAVTHGNNNVKVKNDGKKSQKNEQSKSQNSSKSSPKSSPKPVDKPKSKTDRNSGVTTNGNASAENHPKPVATAEDKALQKSADGGSSAKSSPTTNLGIEFRIQLAAASKPIDLVHSKLNQIHEVVEIKTGDMFKYCTGRSDSYRLMQEKLPEVRKIFPDAFIIALKNGKQISVQDAINEIDTANN